MGPVRFGEESTAFLGDLKLSRWYVYLCSSKESFIRFSTRFYDIEVIIYMYTMLDAYPLFSGEILPYDNVFLLNGTQ